MANIGIQGRLGATDSCPRPGVFPIGSAQSRAAARSLLATRRAREGEQGFRFVTRSILDGKRVNFDGIAETIRAARMRDQAGELPAWDEKEFGGEDHSEGAWGDCLMERMKRARERVAQARGLETMP
jgi:hypothetical protein